MCVWNSSVCFVGLYESSVLSYEEENGIKVLRDCKGSVATGNELSDKG